MYKRQINTTTTFVLIYTYRQQFQGMLVLMFPLPSPRFGRFHTNARKCTQGAETSVSQAAPSRTPLTLRATAQYPTALRAWCKQCLPGRRKPDVRRCHPLQQRRHNVLKSASQVVLGRVQPIIATHRTPHGASRLAQTMSVWSVKPRRAPPRQCIGGRVYGHTTTAMHDNS